MSGIKIKLLRMKLNKRLLASLGFLILVLAAFGTKLLSFDFSFSKANADEIKAFSDFTSSDLSAIIESPKEGRNQVRMKGVSRLEPDNHYTAQSEQSRQVICNFKKIASTVPHRGPVQVFAALASPYFNSRGANIIWIKSEECPEHLYSIVQFFDDGRIQREIDCRHSNLKELAIFSGEQGNVYDKPSSEATVNFAISGNGYFVVRCPDNNFMLSRDGRFRSLDGALINSQGCFLLDSAGSVWTSGSAVNNEGCDSQGQCIGLLDPAFDETGGLEYKNSYSFTAQDILAPGNSVTRRGPSLIKPTLLTDAVENLWDAERGPTGVSWINHPIIDIDNINCHTN